jgi:hypothetical protein
MKTEGTGDKNNIYIYNLSRSAPTTHFTSILVSKDRPLEIKHINKFYSDNNLRRKPSP